MTGTPTLPNGTPNPYYRYPEAAPPETLHEVAALLNDCVGYDGTADTCALRRAMLGLVSIIGKLDPNVR